MEDQKPLLHISSQGPPSGFNPPPVRVQTQSYPPPNRVRFANTPVQVRCPNCRYDVETIIHRESGDCSCLACFCLGGWTRYVDEFKDAVHTCPNCKHTCGVWRNSM